MAAVSSLSVSVPRRTSSIPSFMARQRSRMQCCVRAIRRQPRVRTDQARLAENFVCGLGGVSTCSSAASRYPRFQTRLFSSARRQYPITRDDPRRRTPRSAPILSELSNLGRSAPGSGRSRCVDQCGSSPHPRIAADCVTLQHRDALGARGFDEQFERQTRVDCVTTAPAQTGMESTRKRHCDARRATRYSGKKITNRTTQNAIQAGGASVVTSGAVG